MAVLASDTFTRPDDNFLGNCETGQPWLPVAASGDWIITTNRARRLAGSVNATVAANIAGDHNTSVDTVLALYVGGNQLFGVIDRSADVNNFILWERVLVPGTEDAVKLYVQVGGVFTERGIWGGPPDSTGLDPNFPVNLRVEARGLDLACYVNDVERVAYTLTGPENAALGNAAGMRCEGVTTVLFDGFLVESIVAAGGNLARKTAVHYSARAGQFPYGGIR